MPSFLKQAVLAGLAATAMVQAGQKKTVADWGDNPSKLPPMLVYTPDKLATKPAVILALHPCGGTGQIPSRATAAWALRTYGGDPTRVFAVGGSSGAMFANVLAGTYPDVFAAAVSYSGVPCGCWAGSPMSTPLSPDLSCPLGGKEKTHTAQMWGDLARKSDPEFNASTSGSATQQQRPRMMIVHGTADTAVVISMLKAQLDQWSNVLGVTFSGNTSNNPIRNWKKICYGDCTKLVGYEVQGGGHIPPFQAETTLKFLGLL